MGGLWKCLLFYVLTCLGRKACGSEIVNGEKASDGSMPYMVSLQKDSHHHVCGGFLISEDFVLTAAHCDDYKPTRVVLGTHNLKMLDNGNIREVEKKYKPRLYSEVGSEDIMLLKLSAKIQLTKNVQTITIPSYEMNLNETTECSVAGWGKIKTDSAPQAVDELRVVNVTIINQKVCEKEWGKHLPANVICAGGYNTSKGFCQGDSGGPLVCNGVAVGIVSFNNQSKCDYYSDVPNVYTDISKHLCWINEVLHGANGHE